MHRKTSGRPAIPGILLIAATLVACGGEDSGDVSQVVARVNDSEITISQLRATLLARGETEPSPDTTRRTLEGLVNEQLLVEAALRNDLDRDPAVVQALEAARRQILANVFVERLVYPHEEVSAAEQTAYFREHPELFAKRRVYQLAAFACPQAPLPEDVMTALDTVKTADDVAGVLESGRLACSVQTLTRASEQLALTQVAQFAAAATGDVIVQARDGGETTLMLIKDIQDSPLMLEQAQPIIQQYLANVRNAQALDSHLKEARAASVMHIDTTLFAASAPEEASAPAPIPETELAPDSGAAILN